MSGPPGVAFFRYETVNQILYQMRRYAGNSYSYRCCQPSCACAKRIISNTAQAEWESGGQTLSRPSNTVDIVVDRTVPPPPTTLELFRFTSGSGAQATTLPATMCMSTNGPRPVDLSGAFSQYSANPAPIAPTSAIRAGEPLILKVSAPAQNLSATAVDSFTTTITIENGDRRACYDD